MELGRLYRAAVSALRGLGAVVGQRSATEHPFRRTGISKGVAGATFRNLREIVSAPDPALTMRQFINWPSAPCAP